MAGAVPAGVAPGGALHRRRAWGRWAAVALTAGLAAALTWATGHRGLFAFDQSILFDGGYRVASGQVPFRDFVAPFGLPAFWLQGAVFAVLGVSWSTYVLTAAAVDALAVVVTFGLLRSLLPGRVAVPLLGAALAGVWLLPPSGTPWLDSVAFALALLAFSAAADGWRVDAGRSRWRGLLPALAGALWVAALLGKQNAGLATLPPLLVLVLRAPAAAGGAAARMGRLAAGALGAAALFAAWLFARAEPLLFAEHWVRLPLAEALARASGEPGRALATALLGAGPAPVRGALLLAVLPALAVLASRHRRGRRRIDLAVLLVALSLAHGLFLAGANNQPEIALPWTGLIVALGLHLAAGLVVAAPGEGRRGGPSPAAVLTAVTAAASVAVLAAWGVDAAWSRRVHDVFPPSASFDRRLDAEGLDGLRWGRPTRLWEGGAGGGWRGAEVRAAEVEALLSRLRAGGEPFFTFPDWTLLYGLAGAPSPQPLLWFHPGLTYPPGGDPALDRRIVAALRRHGVERVVLEEVSWFGTGRRLADFPRLRDWFGRCFVEEERLGTFRLLRRAPGCVP